MHQVFVGNHIIAYKLKIGNLVGNLKVFRNHEIDLFKFIVLNSDFHVIAMKGVVLDLGGM